MPEYLIKAALLIKNVSAFYRQFGEKNIKRKVDPKSKQDKPNENQDNKPDISIEAENETKEKQLEQEKQDKIQREVEEFDSNLAVLNYFAFFILFLFILTCDLVFWISIGN
jgi:hypothetical protein